MFLRLLLLFTVVPLVELYLLIQVGSYIGALPTVEIVVGTGILGGLLARNQGLALLRKVQREVQEGRLPTSTLFDGLLILIAGVVLVTPGLLTDCLGLVLLMPWARQAFKRWLASKMRERVSQGKIPVYTIEQEGNPNP